MVEELPQYDFPPAYQALVQYSKTDKAKSIARNAMHRKVRQRMRAFLQAYVKYGSVAKAAQATGIARSTHVKWSQKWDFYKEWYAEAQSDMCDNLESTAHKRAVKGWKEPVFHNGVQVGHKRRYSDRLLEFLLRGNIPDKYAKDSGNYYDNSSTQELNIQVVLEQIREQQPEYAQFLRDSAVQLDSSTVRQNGQQRRLEISSPSITDGSGDNGHHRSEVSSGDSAN